MMCNQPLGVFNLMRHVLCDSCTDSAAHYNKTVCLDEHFDSKISTTFLSFGKSTSCLQTADIFRDVVWRLSTIHHGRSFIFDAAGNAPF